MPTSPKILSAEVIGGDGNLGKLCLVSQGAAMPKIVRIPKTAIDNLTIAAEQLPAKEPSDFALKDAIERLMPTIENLQAKGYNLVEINTLLTDNHIVIGINTLKQYLTEFTKKTSRKKTSSKTSKPPSSKTSNLPQTKTESPKADVAKPISTGMTESKLDLNIPKLANTGDAEVPLNNAPSSSQSLMNKLKTKP